MQSQCATGFSSFIQPIAATLCPSRLGCYFRRGVKSISSGIPTAVLNSSKEHRAYVANGYDDLLKLVSDFDPSVPIELASTPPSSWYTRSDFLSFEMEPVFYRGWQVAGMSSQVENPGDYFTGSLGSSQYIVCRDEQSELHAFHNVCRHHAAPVASQSGCAKFFECPYHGWTYSLSGKFQKATRLSGIKNFKASENGLHPIRAATWGPFVLLQFSEESAGLEHHHGNIGEEWLGDAEPVLSSAGIDTGLTHLLKREYVLNCNWKVFCDNYLDGGYHVPFAHRNLASGLSLDSYITQVLKKVSIQYCKTGDDSERLGNEALYAFVYPNFMINRYGPWMDTNLVIPISASKCRVVFDYFLDASLMNDKKFIEESLAESDMVQVEDIGLCEGVQIGLESPGYCKGRYAPEVEIAMHHFHCLLHSDLASFLGSGRT